MWQLGEPFKPVAAEDRDDVQLDRVPVGGDGVRALPGVGWR